MKYDIFRYQYPNNINQQKDNVLHHQLENKDNLVKNQKENVLPEEEVMSTDPPVDGQISDLDQPHPHDLDLDRNLTLINITNFKFLINNDICNVSKISIVTIIHSSSQNTVARDMIR